jgi:hypothetical protein
MTPSIHKSGSMDVKRTKSESNHRTRVSKVNFSYTCPAVPTGALPCIAFKEEHTPPANNSTLMPKHLSARSHGL